MYVLNRLLPKGRCQNKGIKLRSYFDTVPKDIKA